MKHACLHNLSRRALAAVTAAVVFGLAVHLNDVKHQLAALIAVGLAVFVLYGPVLRHGKQRLFYGLCAGVTAAIVAAWLVIRR